MSKTTCVSAGAIVTNAGAATPVDAELLAVVISIVGFISAVGVDTERVDVACALVEVFGTVMTTPGVTKVWSIEYVMLSAASTALTRKWYVVFATSEERLSVCDVCIEVSVADSPYEVVRPYSTAP
jgi:hypothetical protein